MNLSLLSKKVAAAVEVANLATKLVGPRKSIETMNETLIETLDESIADGTFAAPETLAVVEAYKSAAKAFERSDKLDDPTHAPILARTAAISAVLMLEMLLILDGGLDASSRDTVGGL